MKKYNILNHYNKDTELSVNGISFEDDEKERLEKETFKEQEEYKFMIKSLVIPDFNKINFTRDTLLYLTLGLFFIISLIGAFFGRKIGNVFAIILLLYVTVCVTDKMCEFPNTRYMNIATWNLYNSVKMLLKSVFPNLLEKFDYIKIISFSNVIYIASLVIGVIPSYSYLAIVSLILVSISYLSSFCNQDFESIKESIKLLNNISPIILIITSIIGSIFYSSDALNLVGYMVWLIIYYINHSIKNYEFKEI